MKNVPNIYIRSIITELRQKRFRRSFSHIGKNSGFGKFGYGDSCRIWDCARISVGDQTWFGPETIIQVIGSYPLPGKAQEFSSSLQIGNDVHATGRCHILCAGNMIIEDEVLIAPGVYITDNNHGLNPTNKGGYGLQPLSVKNVKIGKGVWLGQGAFVLPGVTIGAHSVIGAGSVVTKDIPPYSIAVGNPARVVKRWDENKQEWVKISR